MKFICYFWAVLLVLWPTVSCAQSVEKSVPKSFVESFPSTLSSDIPKDIDTEAFGQLDLDTQIPEAQRLFDIFSWQAFIALNWPANMDGSPDKDGGIAGKSDLRVWMSWRSNDTIFLEDGGVPAKWDGSSQAEGEKFLWKSSKMISERNSPVNQLHETNQAFTGPLIDQNGKFVRYESYINKPMFDYIYTNKLYNQEGQADFTAKQAKVIDFPVSTDQSVGSMGIKLAWKELGPEDIPSRFLTRKYFVVRNEYDKDGALIYGDDGLPKTVKTDALMGLVGMHVTALTPSAPNWIWATFEHVDNVTVNDLETGTSLKGEKVRLRPSFNNTDSPLKPVNQLHPKNALPGHDLITGEPTGALTGWDESRTTDPTQLTRLVPIPLSTAELNTQVREMLSGAGSVLQYYELIGTQWPVQPGFPAFSGGMTDNGNFIGSAPESLYFKVPGRVVPVLLVNVTMESFFQDGLQVAGPQETDFRLPIGTWASNPTEPVVSDRTKIFATESCVGCHYSAGAVIGFKRDFNGRLLRNFSGNKIPIYGKDGSFGQTGNAGYFWQFQLKARSGEPPQPAEVDVQDNEFLNQRDALIKELKSTTIESEARSSK